MPGRGGVPDGGPTDDDPDGSDPAALADRLFNLARLGDFDRLEPHLDAGTPVDLTDADGNSLLMLAAYHGHAACVRSLLDRGATVDAINEDGRSPLSGAVFKNHPDVVHVLLEFGADPNAGTPSPIDTATYFDREELYELLLRALPDA